MDLAIPDREGDSRAISLLLVRPTHGLLVRRMRTTRTEAYASYLQGLRTREERLQDLPCPKTLVATASPTTILINHYFDLADILYDRAKSTRRKTVGSYP